LYVSHTQTLAERQRHNIRQIIEMPE